MVMCGASNTRRSSVDQRQHNTSDAHQRIRGVAAVFPPVQRARLRSTLATSNSFPEREVDEASSRALTNGPVYFANVRFAKSSFTSSTSIGSGRCVF